MCECLRKVLNLEKILQQPQKFIQLIVVNPVAGLLQSLHLHILENFGAAVLSRIGSETLGPVYQQRRAAYFGVNGAGVLIAHAEGGEGTDIIIKLPTVSAIFILVHPVYREMMSLCLREMGVGFLHPRRGFLYAWVTPSLAARQLAQLIDPAASSTYQLS